MEWSIKSISSRCAVSGEPFREGDSVICMVFGDEHGNLSRLDVIERNIGGLSVPGHLLGKWRRVISSRNSENSESNQASVNREEFFFSLFDGDSDEKKEILKQIFALFLERKRILRSCGKNAENFIKYVHVKTKREFLVSDKELKPEDLTFVDNVLEMLS